MSRYLLQAIAAGLVLALNAALFAGLGYWIGVILSGLGALMMVDVVLAMRKERATKPAPAA